MTAATSTPTTAPPTRPPAPPKPRLQLDPTMGGTGIVDGGWWPRSRDPDAELPGLIARLDSFRWADHPGGAQPGRLDSAPRRVAVDGRRVRVGWFRHMDVHAIGVTGAFQDRVALLVVPPQATTAAAGAAMAMAADGPTAPGRPTSWQPPD
jgi:hypothetical protein